MAERFTITKTPIPDVFLATRHRVEDERGWFERLFDLNEMSETLGIKQIHQVNRAVTQQAGTIRGLHFQLPPRAETKIVACLRGKVFDVAVDLRPSSPTYLQWFGCELTSENATALVIPTGCAHGIQTLVDASEILYVHTAPYVASSEAGLNPLDPDIGIDWPLPVGSISARDSTEARRPHDYEGVQW